MTKAEDKAARILGAKGGKARARRLTPEQRSESARKAAKARWDAQGALQRVRDAIEKIKSGNLDLMRARMIRQIMNYQVQVAALSVRAERSGIESDFFNLHVDPKELKEFRALVKQLSAVIKARQEGR